MKKYTIVFTGNDGSTFFIRSSSDTLQLVKQLSDARFMPFGTAKQLMCAIETCINTHEENPNFLMQMEIKISSVYKMYPFDVSLYKTAVIKEVEFNLK